MKRLLITLMALTGCARLPLVRECGAVVGDHSGAQEFEWVQPCGREDRDGCEGSCRPARDVCEVDNADFRDPRLVFNGKWEKHRGDADRNLARIMAAMAVDCAGR